MLKLAGGKREARTGLEGAGGGKMDVSAGLAGRGGDGWDPRVGWHWLGDRADNNQHEARHASQAHHHHIILIYSFDQQPLQGDSCHPITSYLTGGPTTTSQWHQNRKSALNGLENTAESDQQWTERIQQN